MKIKRTQTVGKTQFVVVSHFENAKPISVKNALSKIMLNMSNEELNAAKATHPNQNF